jgi:hypothetical protein
MRFTGKFFMLLSASAFFSSCSLFSGSKVGGSSQERRVANTKATQSLAQGIFDDKHWRDSLAKHLPVNTLCGREVSNFPNQSFSEASVQSLTLAMFLVGRSKESPIVITRFDSGLAESLIDRNVFDLDFSLLPDGEYHGLLCSDTLACQYPTHLDRAEVSARLHQIIGSARRSKEANTGMVDDKSLRGLYGIIFPSNPRVIGVAPFVTVRAGKISHGRHQGVLQDGRLVHLSKLDSSPKQKSFGSQFHIKYASDSNEILPYGPCQKGHTAIMIHLGRGKVTMEPFRQEVRFDFNSDGFSELISWPRGDGLYFLGRDGNGNGLIDHGNELFLVSSHDAANSAYNRLRALDQNKDGRIDRRDDVFKSLVLWQDKNQNGKSENQEIFSLGDIKILSLSLNTLKQTESGPWRSWSSERSFVIGADRKFFRMFDLSIPEKFDRD